MVFSPILPIIKDEFAIDHAAASSIFIFISAGFGVALIGSGLFSGMLGHKKSIVFSLALTGLAAFLIPLVHNFFLLYPFAFLLGFSVGLYLPSAIPLITEYYSEKDWGKTIAIQDTGGHGYTCRPLRCPRPSLLLSLARDICRPRLLSIL